MRTGEYAPIPVFSVHLGVGCSLGATPALKEAKIKEFRWHDLRHTFCSRLAQAGVSLKVIQEAAGHKTIAISARYAHMDHTTLQNAMAVLNRAL
jgi:site-specific recombinase XerD